jgi:hypothetical protein
MAQSFENYADPMRVILKYFMVKMQAIFSKRSKKY